MVPIKLFLKVVIITGIAAASPIIYAMYLIQKGIIGSLGFMILWTIAGGIILLLAQYYIRPKFRAYIESLPKHEVGI